MCVDFSHTLIHHLKERNKYKRAGIRYHQSDVRGDLAFEYAFGFDVAVDKVMKVLA